MLDSTLIAHIHSNMPPQWHATLRDGSATTWGWQCIPSGLFDGEDDEGPRQPQYAVHTPRTLVSRPLVRTTELRVKTAYTALVAADFQMPRSLDPSTGQAKHADLFADVPDATRPQALARAVKCIKHPAVPPEFCEVAYRVGMDALPYGPSKRSLCGRATCPCGRGVPEVPEHTFQQCPRSARLLDMVLGRWRRVTGETKVVATDGRVALFGDRSSTWTCDAEWSTWAGLEEPFAVIHKVTLNVIHQERNRDAAPHPGRRRTAAELYQKVAATSQRVLADSGRRPVPPSRVMADGLPTRCTSDG